MLKTKKNVLLIELFLQFVYDKCVILSSFFPLFEQKTKTFKIMPCYIGFLFQRLHKNNNAFFKSVPKQLIYTVRALAVKDNIFRYAFKKGVVSSLFLVSMLELETRIIIYTSVFTDANAHILMFIYLGSSICPSSPTRTSRWTWTRNGPSQRGWPTARRAGPPLQA